MKFLKILIIVLLLVPQALDAKKVTKRKSTAKKTSTTQVQTSVYKGAYPLFNETEAARLWNMKKEGKEFSDEDLGAAIDLCNVAYNYLNDELQFILDKNMSLAKRQNAFLNLDSGVGETMMVFAEQFGRYLHQTAANEGMVHENIVKLKEMLPKKDKYNKLKQRVFSANPSK